MSNQLFINDLIVTTYTDRVSDSGTWSFSGGISKGLGHSRMVVGCDFRASVTSASSMRDNTVTPYRQTTAGIKPYFKGSLLRWLSLSYDADYGFSRMSVDGDPASYHSLNQNLYLTLIPKDQLQFTVGAEHFMTHFPEGNTANLILLDTSAVWRLNSKIRLSLTANNLLNKHEYRYINYGTLSRTEHTFRIRPRNILATIQYRF